MTDMVTIEIELPEELAEEVDNLALEEPELLARMLQYMLTRREVFRHLKSEDERRETPVRRETGRHGSLSAHDERLTDENPDG